MKIGSLAFKLALLVGMLGLLQAIAVFAFSYFTMSRSLDEQQRHALRDTLIEARNLLDQEPNLAAVNEAAHRVADLLDRHEDTYLAVADASSEKRLIAFSSIAVESLHRLKNDIWARDAFLEWRAQHSAKPMLSVASASAVRDGGEYVMVLSVDRSRDQQLLSGFLLTALTAAPFGLAVVSIGALVIVSVGLRPLNHFRDAAVSVTTKHLSKRIDPKRLPSELLPMCAAFNGMLDRLDDGIQRLSQFSADLAHEMRTPVATLLGRTQVALSQPRTHEQLLELLEGNVDELERLSRLISDMLFLASAENAQAVLDEVQVDLLQETQKVIEYLEIVALERDISFELGGQGSIMADRGLVQRAITNLLSNAIHYGSARSQVLIHVETRATEVALRVINHGQDLLPEQRDKLFDRFYRADPSRSRQVGGTGLGLTIVKAIMSLHRGSVSVSSPDTGTIEFALHFPRAANVVDTT